MLSKVRNTLKGAVAWFVIVLLILAFALFGVPELGQFTGNSAITVGDKKYSAQYVQSEFTRMVQAQRAESGGTFTREDALASGMQNQVVANITTAAALDQYSENMRLAMPREIVRDFLQQNESFQNPATGKFDNQVLLSILQRNNMSVTEFERRIAEELQRNQLANSLVTRAPAPDQLVEAVLLRDTEQRRIGYLIVTDEMAGKAAEPTPDDLQKYYDENPAAFTAPEYRTFDMVILRSEDFRETIEAPEEEIRRLYDLNKERLYDKPELRTLYQTTFDTEAEALAAVAALRNGKPFENLASERGLSLDAVTFSDAQKRDILDPAVAEAAFADGLEEGSIVDPIQSLFGWTVVQIAGVTPPDTTDFEEVREEIEENYLNQDTRRALLSAIDKIEEVRDTGSGLTAAAESADIDVTTVGPVDRYSFAPGGAIVNDIPGEVLAEVFRLEEEEESEAIELASRDGYFLVALGEIRPPALIPFDDVRDEVEQRWRKDERKNRIAATVEGIRKTVSEGASLDEAASQFDRTPTEIVIDRRFTNEAISAEFNNDIFAAAPDSLVSGSAALGEADVIAEIRKVSFARNRVSPDQASAVEQYLGYQIDQELIEAFLTAVREDLNIKVNQAQLDAAFGEAQ